MSTENEDLTHEGLSDEELEALEMNEDGDIAPELLKELSEDEGTEDHGVGDEDQDDEEPEEDEDKDEDNDKDETEDTGDDAVKPASHFVPTMDADPERLATIEAGIEELSAKAAELRTQLDDGGIDLTDYHKEIDEINSSKMEMIAERSDIRAAERFNELTPKQLWQHDQDVFFEDPKNSVFIENKMLMGALDAAVKDIGGQEGNANRTGAWVLNEARKQVLDTFNLASVKENSADSKENGEDKAPKKARRGPRTLADLPEAEGASDLAGDEFAELDKLDGYELEMALSRMSEEQKQRYLA